MSSSNSDKKVIVCGGGLVGCLATCYLAKRNFDVELYEFREDIRKLKTSVGRSINMAMSERGREGLRRIGCEESITSKGIEMHSRMLHDFKGKMSAVRYGQIDQSILSIDRRYLNELLLNEVEKYKNVKVYFNHKLQRCNTSNGDVVFLNSNTNQEVKRSSDLIIGCDGAYSIVRQSLLKDKPIDFSQKYISSYYLELRMPPTNDGNFAMPINYLHIWPRGDFMLIALPNQDKSFTCTLFMPLKMFEEIKSDQELIKFFEKYFPDTIPLFGKNELIEMFFAAKPSSLISIKCNPHHGDKCILLGDSAHSMVPFYGQGMNCGFEDCVVFFDLLDQYGFENIATVLNNYSTQRVPDAHAIIDLAMYNYVEMRYLVTTFSYRMRKTLDNFLHSIFPNRWIPLYTMVTFKRIPYSEVIKKREKQNKIIRGSLYALFGGFVVALGSIWFVKSIKIRFNIF